MKVIGLISGTSVDGIDAALVDLTGSDFDLKVEFIAGATYPYPDDLRAQILTVAGGGVLSMPEWAALDDAIALQFAQAAQKIQKDHNSSAALIGSHGQTVFHRPPQHPQAATPLGYTLQLGRGDLISYYTRIPTVSNFRAADIAATGQGAPLVSRIDAYLLSHPHQKRCIQNLGGIGNVTYLPPREQTRWEEQIIGWDTGPGNILIDLAVQQLTQGQQTYDADGTWAAQGTPCLELVQQWLQQDFFQQAPPKSTGRELFGRDYLQQCWQTAQTYSLSDADWLATLAELTAASVAHSYQTFLPTRPDSVLICGGGSRNSYLKQRLQAHLAPATLLTTDELGLNSDYKEAIAFAILAYWRYVTQCPGNLPSVTGASQALPLGDMHPVY
ncbi:anhydro-N-acetylmuramic acid kinase [Spirulina subsalsa FACHB-351]|uniref:Anhydro-N-acetylmuramic acid kinase n=1 Tax=Spirulina subsalsa FACHB-351 TaxID=234711 RepID=A0ABT3L5G9_9CYAN|nr:anhydro-N-acetylmuramic acid kinase [Spirulina subsalsa]MCW6036707.1 anhydro-N-acetylmuramic acid kinase [Spirulina subsalsa FACHB-351]